MTSSARRIQTTLTAIGYLTQAVQARLPATLNRLTLELESFDGYKTDCRPVEISGKGSPGSRTEHHALAPDERNDADTKAVGPAAVLDELHDYLRTAAQCLEIVCRECDRRTPGITTIDISRLRCATIPAGACQQWADPARTDGLCCDHGRTTDTNRRRLRDHRARTA